MVRAEDIRKSFGQLEVLKGISFTLERGHVLSIIGPSGSGKSTLLRIITQLEKADGGTLEIAGERLFEDALYVPSGASPATRGSSSSPSTSFPTSAC